MQMDRDLNAIIEMGDVGRMDATSMQKWQLLARELA